MTITHDMWVNITQIGHLVAPYLPIALIGGAITSAIYEPLKGWLVDPKHKRTANILRQAIAFLVVAGKTFIENAPTSATSVAIKTFAVSAGSSGMYIYILRPLYRILSEAQDTYQTGKEVKTPTVVTPTDTTATAVLDA